MSILLTAKQGHVLNQSEGAIDFDVPQLLAKIRSDLHPGHALKPSRLLV